MFLTSRAALAAALAAAGAGLLAVLTGIAPIGLVALADAVVLVVAALDVALAPAPAACRPGRVLPEVAQVGRAGTIALEVANPARRPVDVAVRDASPPSLGRSPAVHRVALPPLGRAILNADIRPGRRGRITLGPITLRTGGPFGFAGRQSRVAAPVELKVYPALPGRAEVELRMDRARLLQSGERSSAVRGGGNEFDSVREYHPDDEFRRINWRATARASKPMSSVFREERNQQVLLVLDAGRTMAGNLGGVSRFEHAIDAAVAVAELAARVGDHVGMAAFGRTLVTAVPPRSGRAQPARILDALFAVEPTLDASSYAQAFASVLARWRRRSLIVLITELGDEAAMEPLLRALPVLARRHLLIIGAVLDPATEELAAAVPTSSEAAYQKAAAAGALDTRARTASRIGRLGATVVDARPGTLAGRLADQYLRIKAFGRL